MNKKNRRFEKAKKDVSVRITIVYNFFRKFYHVPWSAIINPLLLPELTSFYVFLYSDKSNLKLIP